MNSGTFKRVALCLATALVAMSCSSATQAPVPSASTGPAEPTGTLNVGLKVLGTFSCHPRLTGTPQAPTLASAGFETLVTTDAKGNYLPMLAESWQVSSDNRVWTFNLRHGVQFHKGYGEMTADDVVYSLSQAAAEGTINGNSGNYVRLFAAKGGYIKAVDKYTVAIDTATPQFDMLNWLRSPISGQTWIISKKQVDAVGEAAANKDCAGTGPWEFVEAKDGQYWKFKAVRGHWRKTPEFDELVLWELPEETTRVANFQAGKLDTLVSDLDSIPTLSQVSGARVMVPGGGAEMHLGMYGNYYTVPRPAYDPATMPWVSKSADTTSADWDKAKRVRQAMSLAIDRDTIVKTLLHGQGTPALGWAWAGHADRIDPDEKWTFDPAKAKQMLSDAGYPNGFEVTLTPRLTGTPAEVQACEAIGTMWGNIGLKVKFQNPPNDAIRPSLVGRSYKGITCQGVGNVPEPINQYTNWAVTSGGFNGGVEHPFVDDLVSKATKTFDTEARWAIEKQIGRWMFDNALDIGIYNVDIAYAIGPRIEDWSKNWFHGDARIPNGFEYVRHRS